MIWIVQHQGLMRDHQFRIALGLKLHQTQGDLVQTKVQDRVIQFTRTAQHP